MTIDKQLRQLGFVKNHQIFNGFIPHYIKGGVLLFLIGKDFHIGKIVKICEAYAKRIDNVYGVLTDKAPACAELDWCVKEGNIKLLNLNPLSIAKWKTDGSGIEYIPLFL